MVTSDETFRPALAASEEINARPQTSALDHSATEPTHVIRRMPGSFAWYLVVFGVIESHASMDVLQSRHVEPCRALLWYNVWLSDVRVHVALFQECVCVACRQHQQ